MKSQKYILDQQNIYYYKTLKVLVLFIFWLLSKMILYYNYYLLQTKSPKLDLTSYYLIFFLNSSLLRYCYGLEKIALSTSQAL